MHNTSENGESTARLKTPSHTPTETGREIQPDVLLATARLASIVIGIMAFGKLIIGLMIGSVSLLSEGLHTFIDLFAAIISYYTVREASRPADTEHRYGHGKLENLAGLLQAAFIFVPTLIIIYRAIQGLINLETVLAEGGADLGTAMMFLTIVVNIFLALRLMGVAKKYRSEAIRAAAYHQFNDLWTSIGVLIALALIWWKPELKILDPIVALIVTSISIWMAWQLLRTSLLSLADRSAGREIDRQIISVLESQKPLVRGYHNLRTRISGSTIHADLHVEVCGNMTFRQAHEIIETAEEQIAEEVGDIDVLVHADPCEEPCEQCEIFRPSVEIPEKPDGEGWTPRNKSP